MGWSLYGALYSGQGVISDTTKVCAGILGQDQVYLYSTFRTTAVAQRFVQGNSKKKKKKMQITE